MIKLSSPVELVKKSVNLFSKKENFLFLAKIYSPVAILSVLTVAQGYLPDYIKNSNSYWLLGEVITIQLLYFVVSIFVTVAGIIAIGKIVQGKEFTIKATFLSAKKSYWMFLLLSIVLAIAYALGFILLIVPGFLFIVWFVFSKFIMIEKGTRLKESLSKSKELAKGNYWKILGRLIVFGLFVFVVQMALSIIPFGIGSIAISLCGGLFMLPTYLLYRELSA